MLANFAHFATASIAVFAFAATQIITTDALNPIGEGMKSAASAALPVGVGVMAVTAGIPIAKKIIKQLGR